jgi:hypothetical protein
VQTTLCLKNLGMSQVTTQVSETKISDTLVTGHTVSELLEMIQYYCNDFANNFAINSMSSLYYSNDFANDFASDSNDSLISPMISDSNHSLILPMILPLIPIIH